MVETVENSSPSLLLFVGIKRTTGRIRWKMLRARERECEVYKKYIYMYMSRREVSTEISNSRPTCPFGHFCRRSSLKLFAFNH